MCRKTNRKSEKWSPLENGRKTTRYVISPLATLHFHYLNSPSGPVYLSGDILCPPQCSSCCGRLTPVVSAFFFIFFFFVILYVFVSLIPFHYFTTETALSFPLRDITYQIIISCTRLYTFEKKRENDRKDRVWRQTIAVVTKHIQKWLSFRHVEQIKMQ